MWNFAALHASLPPEGSHILKRNSEAEAEEQEKRFQCLMDGTGVLRLMWALFGEHCGTFVHQSLPLSLGTLGCKEVAHKFCGPVFQSGYALLVIQLWHLVAFELNFCMSCFFICSLTLDELTALSATGFVDLLVTNY